MFKTIFLAEVKGMLRDKMYTFFLIYPVIFGAIGYFLVDFLDKEFPDGVWDEITAMMLIVITGFVFGALISFTLLDDKDDKVLMSLKITPVDVKHYVYVKMIVGMILGLISTIILIYATNFLPNSTHLTRIGVAILGAIQVPSVVLIVNSFSDNKVEGFVVMKLSGLIIMLPLIGFFVTGFVQYLLGVAPGYWAGSIVEVELIPTEDGNILFLFLVGVFYNIFVTWLLMKFYVKRANL